VAGPRAGVRGPPIDFGMPARRPIPVPTRPTRQRAAVHDVLAGASRPLTPDEIRAAAARRVPGLGIATVYRALRQLVDAGAALVVAVPGSAPRYERSGRGHHHHFHCRACGRVFEVDDCPRDLARIAPPGFRVDGHDLVLYGTCATCDA
jgi:Fur family ferric uptake transcriptional regulator